MSFRTVVSLVLTCSLNASASSQATQMTEVYQRAPAAFAKVIRARGEDAMKNGVTAAYAFPLLKAKFNTPADHRYLDGVRASLPKNYRYKFKNYRLYPNGYSAELASGERVEARVDRQGRLVFNGATIDTNRLTAQGTFEAMGAQLNKKHAWSNFDALPTADAQTVVLEVGALIGLGAAAWGLGWFYQKNKDKADQETKEQIAAATPPPKAPDVPKTELTAIPKTFDQAVAVCEEERKISSFEQSFTKAFREQLEAYDIEKFKKVDCDKIPDDAMVARHGINSLQITDIRLICHKEKAYQLCLTRFKDQGLNATAGATSSDVPSSK